MRTFFVASLFLLFCLVHFSVFTQNLSPVKMEPVEFQPFSRLEFPPISEASGIVRSRLWPGVFWVHNDSGDEPRIFPVTETGQIIQPKWAREYQGILIPDAVNVDWEDIATDDEGRLYIADTGNNANARRDLVIYLVQEPYPSETVQTRVLQEIPFYYPEQKDFPAHPRNFDCEAIFVRGKTIYLLTKHRDDTQTSLYRLPIPAERFPLPQPAERVGNFDVGGQVTAADLSSDGQRLVVLTYNAIWLFEISNASESFFNGKVSWLPINAKQCEGICFASDSTLLVINEQRDIFRLDIAALKKLR